MILVLILPSSLRGGEPHPPFAIRRSSMPAGQDAGESLARAHQFANESGHERSNARSIWAWMILFWTG